jgi:hypothetical protein
LALALPSADNNMLARRAMMAMSITSSINMNPGGNLTRDHEPEHWWVTILTMRKRFVGPARHHSDVQAASTDILHVTSRMHELQAVLKQLMPPHSLTS